MVNLVCFSICFSLSAIISLNLLNIDKLLIKSEVNTDSISIAYSTARSSERFLSANSIFLFSFVFSFLFELSFFSFIRSTEKVY